MSNTISIHKKHVVEYAHSSFFKNGTERLHELFNILGVEYTYGDDDYYETSFEVEVESLKEGLEKLKKYKEGEPIEKLDRWFDKFFYSAEPLDRVIECFEWMLSNYDKNHDWIYIEFI